MNRVVLVGNGFDLAHNMKTRYADFIYWYTKSSFVTAYKDRGYNDELMTVTKLNYQDIKNPEDIYDINYFFEFFPEKTNILFLNMRSNYPRNNRDYQWDFKNDFIATLFHSCYSCNWVDIENEYYKNLKKILALNDSAKETQVDSLNNALHHLINTLEKYFQSLYVPPVLPAYQELFYQKIEVLDLIGNTLKASEDPIRILLLNFNYTNLLSHFIKDRHSPPTLINIHGQLGDQTNPIIFGFGDEMDKDYATIEMQTTKKFMRFFKSFGYHRTSNYHNLVRFLDSDLYQVFVLGHSCGLSDRTMLNMIFEHTNCKSIKIFYHQTGSANNFTDLTMEISRHFHNKGETRKLIVDFTRSSPMLQAEE